MKNETTAELPSEWKGYAWSTDYQELYDLLKTGVRAVCLAPYRRNIWDICYARFDATYGFDFGARGISYTRSYPSDDHSFEAFEKICKESDIVFLNPDSTTQIAALRSALERIVNQGYWSSQLNAKEYQQILDENTDIAREALAATPADPVKGDKADLTFAERAEKFRTERNQAWQDFREDSKAAGYTIEDNLANRTLFLSGYESGKSARPDPVREAATALVDEYKCSGCEGCGFEGDDSCIPDNILKLMTALEASK